MMRWNQPQQSDAHGFRQTWGKLGGVAVQEVWSEVLTKVRLEEGLYLLIQMQKTQSKQLPIGSSLFKCIIHRALVAELHQLVASEDPRNGEMQVQLLDMEYVDPKEDSAEAASWRNV
eukprot:1156350-Pelagomonas_calceolata.AAC.2